MRAFFVGLFILLCGISSCLLAVKEGTGTLVVTYQTGIKGERLDRIRFWLKKNDKQQLYPISNACVEDMGKLSKTVVIENLEPGAYTLEFVVPNRDSFFSIPEKRELTIAPNQVVKVNQVIKPRYSSLKAVLDLKEEGSNPKKPLITLHGAGGEIVGFSSSGELNVEALPPGPYTVIFESLNGYKCPQPMEVMVKPEDKVGPIKGTYACVKKAFSQKEKDFENVSAGTVLLFYGTGKSTEFLKQLKFRIKKQDAEYISAEKIEKAIQHKLKSGVLAIIRDLPVGRYEIEFYIDEGNLPQKVLSRQTFDLKKNEVRSIRLHFPVEELVAFKEALHFFYEDEKRGAQEIAFSFNPKGLQPAYLTVQNNLPDAPWSLYRRSMLIYSGVGSINRLKIPSGGPYVIKPEEKEGYEMQVTPKATFYLDSAGYFQAKIYYAKNSTEEFVAETFEEQIPSSNYFHLNLIDVQGGKTILGDPSREGKENELSSKTVWVDPFAIGMYEVTNEEYVKWLNRAFREKKITYTEKGKAGGFVKDLQGHLLLKTMEADPLSQIFTIEPGDGNVTFMYIADKGNHPVINVSWYGAAAFCKDNQLRMPTEAEWECSAGMALQKKDGQLEKFRFGFSQNDISPAWANYKNNDRPLTNEKVLTTEVGFFNGKNKRDVGGGKITTQLAQSPVGAYDMSGNVWEWVWDWDGGLVQVEERNPQGPKAGTKKIAKGGCYDSLADGVRVAERLPLDPEHVDIYTGFRVAKTVQVQSPPEKVKETSSVQKK